MKLAVIKKELTEEQTQNISSEVKAAIAKTVSKLRQDNDISLNKLHSLTKIDRPFLSRIEKGAHTPSISVIAILCKAYKLKLSEFFSLLEKNL